MSPLVALLALACASLAAAQVIIPSCKVAMKGQESSKEIQMHVVKPDKKIIIHVDDKCKTLHRTQMVGLKAKACKLGPPPDVKIEGLKITVTSNGGTTEVVITEYCKLN